MGIKTKNTSHKCEEWVFDDPADVLKRKSMLLVKRLRLLNAEHREISPEFVFDQYFNWRTQYTKFKKLHLDDHKFNTL